MKAIIITIGDELLIGQTIDTNSAWIARELNNIGIEIISKITISDKNSEIIKALDNAFLEADLILMTGGLGPTKDDITKQTLVSYFYSELIVDEPSFTHLKSFFKKRNKKMLDVNYDQAKIPKCCIPLFNREGTAPGMWFEKDEKILVSMPGVPFEMMNIMQEEVLPRLKKMNGNNSVLHYYLSIVGIGESYVAEKIKDIESNLPPHIKLAYLPGLGILKIRLSSYSKHSISLENELEDILLQIKNRIEKYVYAQEDISLENALVKLLKSKNLTLATAESCTGGNISSRIVDVPGASEVYQGSLVSYDNKIKERILNVESSTLLNYGAVSKETVIEMARNCRKLFNTDLAISVSGILGPSGGTEQKPVGLVWFAIATQENTQAFTFTFSYDRPKNKELATVKALDLVRRIILDI